MRNSRFASTRLATLATAPSSFEASSGASDEIVAAGGHRGGDEFVLLDFAGLGVRDFLKVASDDDDLVLHALDDILDALGVVRRLAREIADIGRHHPAGRRRISAGPMG